MTREEQNCKLKAFITCLKCEVSGKCCDLNCSTQYDAGNMGEIIENLETISKALEQEPVIDKIRAEIMELDYKDYDGEEGTNIPPMIYRDHVFDILDKYKAESEDTGDK